jgi:hypothetical protein
VFDGQGRAWFHGRDDSMRLEKDQFFHLPKDFPGFTAVLADSSGQVWFLPPGTGGGQDELRLLCPDGRWLTAKAPGQWVGTILEQSKDTFWSIRGRSFSRLRLTGEPGQAGEAGSTSKPGQAGERPRIRFTIDRQYTGCIPEGIAWAAIDADSALWVLSTGREGLSRYELPNP